MFPMSGCGRLPDLRRRWKPFPVANAVSCGAAFERRYRSINMHRFLVWFSLIAITLDHVPQSLLARLTLHSYAFCDSSQVLVFIVG